MSLLPDKASNARHNYNEVMKQTYAAIDLLEKDPEVRKALKGFATAMTVTETNAGQHSILHNGRQYIGPYQINNRHASAMNNSNVGKELRSRLTAQEALPPKNRDPTAQLLLNTSVTTRQWTVNQDNPYQNQGVLGAISTIIAAKAAASATGKEITELNATEVWLPHKLGINGGPAILKALTENPDTLVSEVESPYGKAVSKAAYNNNFKGNYHSATVEDIYYKTKEKFEKKVHEGIAGNLTPEQQKLFTAATDIAITPSTPTQVAQATIPKAPASPDATRPTTTASARPTVPAATATAAKPAEVSTTLATAPVASASTTKAAAAEPEKPLKPLANLSTSANANMRRLSNNLIGMGMIDTDMKPEMRAQKLAEYIKANNGLGKALEESKIIITQMQTELQKSGELKGSTDGLYGKETRAAHLAYRSTHNKDPQATATQTAQKTNAPENNASNNASKKEEGSLSQANLPSPSPTPVITASTNGRAARV